MSSGTVPPQDDDGDEAYSRSFERSIEKAKAFHRWQVDQETNHVAWVSEEVSDTMVLWHRALELRSRPIGAGLRIDPKFVALTPAHAFAHTSAEYRMGIVVLTTSTSRVAMDALNKGYYSQAMSFVRSLFEAWKRAAYARRCPEESYRWLPKQFHQDAMVSLLGDQYKQERPKHSDWDRVFPKEYEKGSTDNRDREFLETATAHIQDLHDHVHPSLLGIAQHYRRDSDGIFLFPEHDQYAVQYIVREALTAEMMLTYEVEELGIVDEEWIEDISWWRGEYDFHSRQFIEKYGAHGENRGSTET